MEIRCPYCNALEVGGGGESSQSLACSACGGVFSMNTINTLDWQPSSAQGSSSQEGKSSQAAVEFERQWQQGTVPSIEQHFDANQTDIDLLIELIRVDIRHRWQAGSGKFVEDYVETFPLLRSNLSTALSLFEEEFKLRRQTEPDLAPGQYIQRFMRLALQDQSTAESVLATCDTSVVENPELTCSWTAEPLPQIGKFRLLHLAGKGAFGAVYRAHDTELDRFVALKLSRPERELSEAEADRSLQEARNAARLSHPGIVPIFDVGRGEQGTYIVSEYVDGITLADYLTGNRLQHLEATALLKEIVVALDHAHRRSVVHLDLKPSNIMIDGRRRPRIMDFGLAKRQGTRLAVDTEGKILGTPRYMSPEQAHGNWHSADARADIYSLGVIYFELLTGEPPFRGNFQMLVHQIKSVDPPSPRTLNHRLPKDVETIVLKCLEKEPERRYQSASELAEELERVLQGEPILARPISRVERGLRWCKKRPVLVSWIGGLSSLIVLVTAIAFVWISHSRDAALAAAEEALAANEGRQATLDSVIFGASEVLQYQSPHLRENLLLEAVHDYERLAQHDNSNAKLVLQAARARLRVGDLHRELGDAEAARAAYLQARETAESISASDLQTQREVTVGHAVNRLGGLAAATDQIEAAEKLYAEAGEIWNKILAAKPTQPDAIQGLVATLLDQGVLKLGIDELADAERLLTEAARWGKQTDSIDDSSATLHWKNVAEVHSALGQLALHRGDADRAVAEFQQAAQGFQRHHDRYKVEIVSLEAKAETSIRLAGAYRQLGAYAKERDAYRQAIDSYAELNKLLPGVPAFREGLALVRTDLGQWFYEQGSTASARESLELAAVEFADLSSQYRSVPLYYEELATTRDLLGQVASVQGKHAEAEEHFREAVARFEVLKQGAVEKVGYAQRLAICRSHLAQVLGKRGAAAEAKTAFEASAGELLELSQQARDVPAYRAALAHVQMHYGDFLFAQNEPEEAADKYDRAITLWQGVADAGQAPQALSDLAWLLATCRREEVRDPTRASEFAQRALQLSPANPDFLDAAALALLRCEQYPQCLEKLDLAGKYRETAHGRQWLIRAMAQAKLNQPAAAAESLRKAGEWIEANLPDDPGLRRLQQEAEKLLAVPAE